MGTGNGIQIDLPLHRKALSATGAPVTIKVLAAVLVTLVGGAWALYTYLAGQHELVHQRQDQLIDHRLDRIEDKVDHVLETGGMGFPANAPKRTPDPLDGG